MSHQQRPGRQRVGPLFGVVLVVVGAVAALTPVVPNARALDPTPDPGATVDPTADPTPVPDPTPTPVTEPTPDPTQDPTPVPEPTPTDPAPAVTPDPTTAPAPTEEPAPSLDPGATPDPSSSPEPTPPTSDPPSPTPSAGPPGPYVGHAWVETVNRQGQVIARGRLDEPLTDAERFTVYRIRFQLVNAGDTEETVRPAIEVSGDSLAWTPVPQVDPVADLPFYAASDDGRVFKARRVAIDRQDLRLQASDDPLGAPVAGVSSAGRTTTGAITLPAHSFTEVEFAVRATVDAEWLDSYAFRLADGGSPLATRSANARITMIGRPPLDLSPGQRRGKAVRDPVPLYRLDPVFGSMAVIPVSRTGVQAHGGLGAPLAAPGPFEDPHLTYSLTSDACAACHSSHIAQGPSLTLEAAPQSTLCFTCHDGTGAVADVQSDWTSPALPANDPATSSWYSHPATEIAGQASGEVSFEGVLNRRAQCADCHQPHLADATRPVMTTGGWSASGAIGGAAGVSVTNGAAGTAPAYTLNRTSTLEYQLCFKCHSGYTVLPAQDPSHPSRWELDKAIELNPANVSYHPVEAAGKNQTNAMARSLLGSSPFKLWALEPSSTVRCVSCHGDSAVASAAPRPAADASLDNHAGPNRGILLAPYRDRSLLGPLEMYDAADFSLCYVCHAEAPMVDGTGDVRTDTNFNWHGLHTNEIWLNGTGSLDIDVAGAGQGNAVCAECHFRIHGTALAVGGQTPARGLVNFAPDVQPLNGVLRFDAWTPGTQGSCTLTCHGRPHNGFRYEGVP